MVVPLCVGRDKSINALEYAMANGRKIFLATQKQGGTADPEEKDIYSMGTIASIVQMLKLPTGTVKVLIEGKRRGKIRRYIPNPKFYMVEIDTISENLVPSLRTEALIRGVNWSFETYVKLSKRIPSEMLMSVLSIEDPSRLADSIAAHLNLKLSDKQSLLETIHPEERLEKLLALLETELEILQMEKKIRTKVRKQVEESEHYSSEQMSTTQKEAEKMDEFQYDIKELEERIKNKRMSEEATKKARRELKKLKLMSPMSAEATVIRNYIDWLLCLPWKEKTWDKLDLHEAERILEEDHYGLKKIKERILEFLAVRCLVGKTKGPILCFVGPPGVGKTSLARSIARALGRKFVRLSLGGVRDEAEIRGHRRTYIGAMPGKIIQCLRKAGSNNPVFLLDEVDKMSMDFRGDPASALLEVLDPEQNYAFNDHYLDVDYDLSEVMFITTANTLSAIPNPLRDRMEVIRIPGYTELEKLHIAKKFLIKKQREANGILEKNISFSDNSLMAIIHQYTKEAGVRNLEREIATICRKVAKEIVKNGKDLQVKITCRNLSNYLGIPKYQNGITLEKDEIGIAVGLAWTEVGGELLITEVSITPGKGKLTITGKLGEVMQESAQAAMTYVRSRAELLGLDRDFYQNIDVHIHVPEGATPKDGPSAGITIATSIVSALTKIPVKKDVAMTGEITLRGRVLPIGGLKEKLVAAHRGNISTVIIPKDNEKDLKEMPAKILKSMEIVPAETMDEVLKKALTIFP